VRGCGEEELELRAGEVEGCYGEDAVDGGDGTDEDGGEVEEDDREGRLVGLAEAADVLEDVVPVALDDVSVVGKYKMKSASPAIIEEKERKERRTQGNRDKAKPKSGIGQTTK
jgi:hypothetical protein